MEDNLHLFRLRQLRAKRRRLEVKIRAIDVERDRLIRSAARVGRSRREIAREIGLSVTRVHEIIRRGR